MVKIPMSRIIRVEDLFDLEDEIDTFLRDVYIEVADKFKVPTEDSVFLSAGRYK